MARVINVCSPDGQVASLDIKDGRIAAKSPQTAIVTPAFATIRLADVTDFALLAADDVVDGGGALLLSGMIDAHVHSRDPGMTHKESWASLARAAFKGGVVAVCDMPNTDPPTIDRSAIETKRRLAEDSGLLYQFYLGVTQDNLSHMGQLLDDRDLPLCGLKVYYGPSTGNLLFSDLDGLTRALGGRKDVLVTFHAEDQAVIDANAAKGGGAPFCHAPQDFLWHSTTRCTRSAVAATERILAWALHSGQRIHMAHVSTPEEAEMVMSAQSDGARVTMEVAPHHLFFADDDYCRWGGRLKVNPPVRSADQRSALCRLAGEGRFEIFASDHAPHTLEEKLSKDYSRCPSGVPAIEFFAPLVLTFADAMKMSLTAAVKMATCNPAQLFHWNGVGGLDHGKWASFVWMERCDSTILESDVMARCGWSPYVGMRLAWRVRSTWQKGKRVYRDMPEFVKEI